MDSRAERYSAASTPGGGSFRRCLWRRTDWPLSATKVIPPEITPPATGTTLVTVLAKESLVTLTPMSASVFLMTGYQAVFVNACLAICLWSAGRATWSANTDNELAAPPTSIMTARKSVNLPTVSSSTSSRLPKRLCQP